MRNATKPLPLYTILPRTIEAKAGRRPSTEPSGEDCKRDEVLIGTGRPLLSPVSTDPNILGHLELGHLEPFKSVYLNEANAPVISSKSMISILDSRLNLYNFLPINTTPRVVFLFQLNQYFNAD